MKLGYKIEFDYCYQKGIELSLESFGGRCYIQDWVDYRGEEGLDLGWFLCRKWFEFGFEFIQYVLFIFYRRQLFFFFINFI